VKGYLLDTNHVNAWENETPSFVHRLEQIPLDSKIFVCAITVGELEGGHRITKTTNQTRRDEFTAFVVKHLHPNTIPLTLATRTYYAEILARIWDKHRPPPGRRTERHLVELGVDVNDVWTVAVAWEHNLTLLTSDAMTVIRGVVPEVAYENWC
jgi:predicted nucleic acid-binding protein